MVESKLLHSSLLRNFMYFCVIIHFLAFYYIFFCLNTVFYKKICAISKRQFLKLFELELHLFWGTVRFSRLCIFM
jgi:hypothetical protein